MLRRVALVRTRVIPEDGILNSIICISLQVSQFALL
jgi:hypothetical protein